ncbi:hypothetical protein [Gluconacetobacter asukensis]|uniref:Uncharacterized protein n=1 Tax=Gluconacetobacter asukensis TaxID=1017181 RepID=A0A7W4J193_9PROT|nr:hypothetical protein [Gluconacetobacter asukensis]MBB2172863.1 hypothetical protein [Gluconacetobacter asukensis]
MTDEPNAPADPLAAKHAALLATPWRDRVDASNFIAGPASWSNVDGNGGYLSDEGGVGAFCSDDASDGQRALSGDPERFHEAAWAEEV